MASHEKPVRCDTCNHVRAKHRAQSAYGANWFVDVPCRVNGCNCQTFIWPKKEETHAN